MTAKTYILADLINRNAKYMSKFKKHKWQDEVKSICLKEMRSQEVDRNQLKALSGKMWHEIKRWDLTTREVFLLLTCWALRLSQSDELENYTDGFAGLCKELVSTSEAGHEGEVEDISAKEVQEEWERVSCFVPRLDSLTSISQP